MVDNVNGGTSIVVYDSTVTRPWVYARWVGLFGRMLWGARVHMVRPVMMEQCRREV